MEIYRLHLPDWPHGEEHLDIFVELINNFHPTIKFTTEWLHRFIAFLDVSVVLKVGHIATDLYTKPMESH